MDLGLKGKVALVTASSKGLGWAAARGLAAEGASVAIVGRDAATLDAAARAIRAETGAMVLALPADVSQAEAASSLVERTVAGFGRLDILVTNAGGPPAGQFMELDESKWMEAINLNLLSVIRLIKAAVPALKAAGGGRIVNVGSSSVKQAIPGLVTSNVIRAGLHGLFKSLSSELAPDGILLNTVAPGRIDTDRVRGLDQVRATRAGTTVDEVQKQTNREIPLGRYGTAEEFARVVVFLASSANTYVTGQAVLVDGGMVKAL